MPGVTITPVGSGNTEKTNFDIGANENEVKYIIRPTITALTDIEITGVNLKIESRLPEGLTYIPGTSSLEDVEVIEDEETGETVLTWYIYNCTVGEQIPSIEFYAHISEETLNGTQYKATALITEIIGEGEISKLGNPAESYRKAEANIQITNLSAYMLYKQTDTPVIEKDGEMHYRLIFRNSTIQDVTSFQLLDILPYNGDSRGTSYNGTYTLDRIDITGQEGLTIYTTTDESVRDGGNVKDSEILTKYNWEQTTGEVGKNVAAIFIQGTVEDLTTVEMDIYLTTEGNTSEDIYINNATAQTNILTPQIETTNLEVEVVQRGIEGVVWLDSNSNGIMDDEEEKVEGIEIQLLNEAGNRVTDINNNEVENVKTMVMDIIVLAI